MAGKALDKNNLGFLGIDFQYKLIKSFIEEPGFFKELYPIVNQNVFSEALMRTVVGSLKDYFKEVGFEWICGLCDFLWRRLNLFILI